MSVDGGCHGGSGSTPAAAASRSIVSSSAAWPGAATAMLNYYRANIPRYGKAGAPPARIECPTLLIWGEDDIYLNPGLASGNEAFAGNLTVHRLPGVSHWVQQDAPDEVNRLIAEWARGQGLATPS